MFPRLLPALLLLCCLCGSAAAHQQKIAITRLLFNERTGSLEVMHRFSIHDAEHAVRQLFNRDADIFGSEETRQRFAVYVTERFHLKNEQGQALDLHFVGQEVEGNHIWVYQELSGVGELQTLSVRHDALREIWPEQTNMVNVEYQGQIRTLTFFDEVDELSISLQQTP